MNTQKLFLVCQPGQNFVRTQRFSNYHRVPEDSDDDSREKGWGLTNI